MIINTSSDQTLINAFGAYLNRKPIAKIKAFDTDTLQATLDDDSTVTATRFEFFADDEDTYNTLASLVGETLTPYISLRPGAPPSVKSMVYSAGDQTDFLQLTGVLSAMLFECSSCSTKYIMYIANNGTLWRSEKANPSDPMGVATEVTSPVTCGNCSKALKVLL